MKVINNNKMIWNVLIESPTSHRVVPPLVLTLYKLSSPCDPHTVDFSMSDVDQLVPPMTEQVTPSDQYLKLQKVYASLYPQHEIRLVQRSYQHSRRASVGGELYVASIYNRKLSIINAYWPGTGDDLATYDPSLKRVGTINYFMSHTVTLQELSSNKIETVTHILCYAHW